MTRNDMTLNDLKEADSVPQNVTVRIFVFKNMDLKIYDVAQHGMTPNNSRDRERQDMTSQNITHEQNVRI